MKKLAKLSLLSLVFASTTVLAAPKTFVYCADFHQRTLIHNLRQMV